MSELTETSRPHQPAGARSKRQKPRPTRAQQSARWPRFCQATSAVPEDLQYAGSGVTMVEERDLWDMPLFFVMLVGLIGGEWALRRRRGLV